MTSQMAIDILQDGLEDFVYIAGVVSVVIERLGIDLSETREPTVAVLHELLCDGLMIAGDLQTSGFSPWQLSPAAALERIEREWLALGRPPGLGEIAWLANTPEGNRVATGRLDT